MKIKTVIADTNEEYANRLFEALQKQENLSLSVFTDKKCFEQEIVSSRYDVALIDGTMFPSGLSLKNIKLPIILYDDEQNYGGTNIGSMNAVKKFQRASGIYKEFIGLYSEMVSTSAFPGMNKDNSHVICVYSPVGGAGKTTVSVAITNALANKGRSVLYVNFESVASYGALMRLKGGKGMGDAFAALDSSANFSLKLESLLHTTPQGIMYFERFESLLDIYEISPDDVDRFIRAIAETGKADYIIIDMSSEFNALNMRIMDIADKIVLVERHDMLSYEKLRCFTSQKTVSRDYMGKMVSVINFALGNTGKSVFNLTSVGKISVSNGDANEIISSINRLTMIDIESIVS